MSKIACKIDRFATLFFLKPRLKSIFAQRSRNGELPLLLLLMPLQRVSKMCIILPAAQSTVRRRNITAAALLRQLEQKSISHQFGTLH